MVHGQERPGPWSHLAVLEVHRAAKVEDKEAPGSGSPDAELVAGLPYWSLYNVNCRHYWETNTIKNLEIYNLGIYSLQFGHL